MGNHEQQEKAGSILRLLRDKRGLIVEWAVAFISLAIFVIGYFTFLPLTMQLLDAGEATGKIEARGLAILDGYRYIYIVTGAIVVFGLLAYAFAASRKKYYVDYPS